MAACLTDGWGRLQATPPGVRSAVPRHFKNSRLLATAPSTPTPRAGNEPDRMRRKRSRLTARAIRRRSAVGRPQAVFVSPATDVIWGMAQAVKKAAIDQEATMEDVRIKLPLLSTRQCRSVNSSCQDCAGCSSIAKTVRCQMDDAANRDVVVEAEHDQRHQSGSARLFVSTVPPIPELACFNGFPAVT